MDLLLQIEEVRHACQKLNAKLSLLERKHAGRVSKQQQISSENAETVAETAKLKEDAEHWKQFSKSALLVELAELRQEFSTRQQESELLDRDIERLHAALAIQKQSRAKQELYGLMTGKSPLNRPQGDNTAIALRRSLEGELDELERRQTPSRIVARKRCQLTHAQNLC
jgi:septal ring factor EnvC (AmiA/AmiB activator)